jgi:hypothetical protein
MTKYSTSPVWFSAQIRPLWACTIVRAMESPMPMPPAISSGGLACVQTGTASNCRQFENIKR